MLYLSAALPLLLLGLVSALHAYSIANPSAAPSSIFYAVVYGTVFVTPFIVAAGVSKNGIKANVARIYVAHRYVPKSVAVLAYTLLLLSLVLLAAASAGDFDPRRRSTALWMTLLSCPTIVWWHFKVLTSQLAERSTVDGER